MTSLKLKYIYNFYQDGIFAIYIPAMVVENCSTTRTWFDGGEAYSEHLE